MHRAEDVEEGGLEPLAGLPLLLYLDVDVKELTAPSRLVSLERLPLKLWSTGYSLDR